MPQGLMIWTQSNPIQICLSMSTVNRTSQLSTKVANFGHRMSCKLTSSLVIVACLIACYAMLDICNDTAKMKLDHVGLRILPQKIRVSVCLSGVWCAKRSSSHEFLENTQQDQQDSWSLQCMYARAYCLSVSWEYKQEITSMQEHICNGLGHQ